MGDTLTELRSGALRSAGSAARSHKALLLTLLVSLVAIMGVWLVTSRLTGGRIVYSLDDAYIHMAVAKNLVQSGNWGVNADEFSSATSSLLWPLLLSATYSLLGVNEVVPFALNVVALVAAVILVYAVLRGIGAPPTLVYLCLIWVTFLTPLIGLVFTGMEHVLQTFLTLAFVFTATRIAAARQPGGIFGAIGEKVILVLSSVLLAAIRYEGLFVVGLTLFIRSLVSRVWRDSERLDKSGRLDY